MRRMFIYIAILVSLSSCCKEYNFFEESSKFNQTLHPLIIQRLNNNVDNRFPSYYGMSLRMTQLMYGMKSAGFYFDSQEAFKSYFAPVDSNVRCNIDYKHYILVPVQVEIRDVYLGRAQFEAKCYINHQSKMVELYINAAYRLCNSGLNSDYQTAYHRAWYKVPRPPANYSLITIQNTK